MGRPHKPWYRSSTDSWYVEIAGKQHRLVKGKARRDEATKAFYRLMAEGKAGIPDTRNEVVVLRDLVEKFLEWTSKHTAPLTFRAYDRILTPFWESLPPDIPIDQIRPFHAINWLDSKPWNQNTRRTATIILKRLFNWADEAGYLRPSPLARLKIPKEKRRAHLCDEDHAKLAMSHVLGECFRDFLTVLRLTGARPCEIMKLEAAHIDWKRCTATMASKTTEATGRDRVIFLPAQALALCQRQAAIHSSGPLFRTESGRAWDHSTVGSRLRRLRNRHGLPKGFTAGSCRHRWVTNALVAGVPIAQVAELAGHVSTAMIAKHYSQLRAEVDHLQTAAEKAALATSDPSRSSARRSGKSSRAR